MTMQKLIVVIAFLAGAAATSADASEIWEACNSCSNSQYQRKAIRAVPANTPGQFDVYIMDFEREGLRKFRVTTFYDPRERAYLSAALRVVVESHIEYEFVQGVRAVRRDIASVAVGTPIPADVAPSAFDIVHNTLLARGVSDYVNDHLSFWQTIGAPVSVPLMAFGKIVDLNFIISVTFADGSTAKLRLTGLEGSLTEIRYAFELVDGSARDADGNLIPSSANEAAPYVGIFSTQAFAEDMVDFIVRWYSEGGAQVLCRSEESSGGVTVTCKRR
jgi:hypothetical protein